MVYLLARFLRRWLPKCNYRSFVPMPLACQSLSSLRRCRCWRHCRSCRRGRCRSRGYGRGLYGTAGLAGGFGLYTLRVNPLGLDEVSLGVFRALHGQPCRLLIVIRAVQDGGAGRVLLEFQGDVIQDRFGTVVNVSAIGFEFELAYL